MSARAKDGGLGPAARLRRDLSANLAFFTRLPLAGAEAGPPDFGRIAWAAPLAGAVVGAVGGLALMLGQGLSSAADAERRLRRARAGSDDGRPA